MATNKSKSLFGNSLRLIYQRAKSAFAKLKIWDKKITVDDIPGFLNKLTANTKWKLDDQIVNFVTFVVKIWKPMFDKLETRYQKWVDDAEREITNLKEERVELKQSQTSRQKITNEMIAKAKNDIGNKVKDKTMKTELPNTTETDRWRRDNAVGPQHNTGDQSANVFGSNTSKQSSWLEMFQGGNNNMKQKRNLKGNNDLAWYNRGGLLSSVNMPQFLVRKGLVNRIGFMGNSSDQYYVPSVCALDVKLLLGNLSGKGYENAFDRLQTNLRRGNTGSQLYTVLDVEKYHLNLRAGIAVIRYLRRAYGVLRKYDSLDAGKPISFFKAMGLDYVTFRENAASIRYWINQMSLQLHSLLAGKDASLERTAWLFDYIFKDSDDAKCQYYVFGLESISYWNYKTSAFTTLTITSTSDSTGNTGMQWATLLGNLKTFVSQAFSDDKISLIAADIIKAYGLGMVDTYFEEIPENYETPEIFSEEVLNEIQNAKVAGNVSHTLTATGNHITENVKVSGINPYIRATNSRGVTNYCHAWYLNYYKNNINILEYACASRFVWYGEIEGSSTTDTLTISEYGTEVITKIRFLLGNAGSSNYWNLVTYTYNAWSIFDYAVASFLMYHAIEYCWSTFDYAPMLVYLVSYKFNANSASATYYANGMELFDYNNYCVLDSQDQFAAIHNAVIMSLYEYTDVIKDQKTIVIKSGKRQGKEGQKEYRK